MEMMNIEMIRTVVKEEVWMFWSEWSHSDSLFAEEVGKIRYVCSRMQQLVYTTKYSLIQVGSDVKQL